MENRPRQNTRFELSKKKKSEMVLIIWGDVSMDVSSSIHLNRVLKVNIKYTIIKYKGLGTIKHMYLMYHQHMEALAVFTKD